LELATATGQCLNKITEYACKLIKGRKDNEAAVETFINDSAEVLQRFEASRNE